MFNILFKAIRVYGQQASAINGASSNGQNNVNQVYQNNEATAKEQLIQNQNGNAGSVPKNLNAQIPVNFQSLLPQSSISTQSTLSLQQPQNFAQPLNLQLSQIPNFQQTFTVQPSLQFDTSSLPQSAGLQQSKNNPTGQNVYKIPVIQQIPCTKQVNSQQSINLGDFKIQQQVPIASPVLQQIPVQSPQGISSSNTFSSFPSGSISSNCPFTRNDVISNLGGSYVPSTANSYSIMETPKHLTSYTSSPVIAVLSTPNPIPLVTHSVMPYGNQASDILQSPLRISNDFLIDDEGNDPKQDYLTSLIMSLLQSRKSSKCENAPANLGSPYLTSYPSQGSKRSSIKSLLPLIIDIISERRGGCGCLNNCQNCELNTKNIQDTDPQIFGGYSKKRDYSLREEMFRKEVSQDDIPRMVREHKKSKKLKNSIPSQSCEDEDVEYEDCSDEED